MSEKDNTRLSTDLKFDGPLQIAVAILSCMRFGLNLIARRTSVTVKLNFSPAVLLLAAREVDVAN